MYEEAEAAQVILGGPEREQFASLKAMGCFVYVRSDVSYMLHA
jgi:hypothetical protein